VPTTKPTGLPKRGGRKPGVPNKATQEIRLLVRSTVNWKKLVQSLEQRASGEEGSDTAARTLFEYGWGKPGEMAEGNGVSAPELANAIKTIASAFMAYPGQGVVAQRDTEG
jgi:hypothetical protein